MIDCHISLPNPLTHLLHIELRFPVDHQDSLDLILPAWRPGRYELAPFVENIQKFEASSLEGGELKWEKTKPNVWKVYTDGAQELVVRYQYYAYKMDAGNSVLDDRQIYINFINCIFYTHSHQEDQINLKADISKDHRTICSLPDKGPGLYQAKNYQELVDSPLLSSPDLKLLSYTIDGSDFNIAILGNCPLTDEELIQDFKKFSDCQISAMSGFPTKRYDFMIQSLDYTHYHGVEHQNSTVLVLGPNDISHKAQYYEKLMGVASHELFHTWNVTRIRPKEMSPYCFDMETMTKTGFVTEGFTTYYGDLFLKQSGVFSREEYFKELNTLFKRHFENYGRHISTLVQSSQNLWVDGYKNLFPSKKVSIYVKGALCSLILDLTIRKNTGHRSSLIDVVKKLYEKYTYDQGGYDQQQVYDLLADVGGPEIASLIHRLYETTESLKTLLQEALSYVGCMLQSVRHPDPLTNLLGIKLQGTKIHEIAPGSHVEKYLSVGDEVISLNNSNFSTDSNQLLESNLFEIKRGARLIKTKVPKGNSEYYGSYEIQVSPEANATHMENLVSWLGNNHK